MLKNVILNAKTMNKNLFKCKNIKKTEHDLKKHLKDVFAEINYSFSKKKHLSLPGSGYDKQDIAIEIIPFWLFRWYTSFPEKMLFIFNFGYDGFLGVIKEYGIGEYSLFSILMPFYKIYGEYAKNHPKSEVNSKDLFLSYYNGEVNIKITGEMCQDLADNGKNNDRCYDDTVIALMNSGF